MKSSGSRRARQLVAAVSGAVLAAVLSGCSPQSVPFGSFIVGKWDCVRAASPSSGHLSGNEGYHIVVSSDGSIRSQMFDSPGHLINEVFTLHYTLSNDRFLLTWPERTSTVVAADVPGTVQAGKPVKIAFLSGLTDRFSAKTDGKSLSGVEWEGQGFNCDPSK